ncbi:hypothetical protein [Methylobacter sp. S3L5C]|uniref:hypothetical protein n=1 Tax=Methylobacter sp. S3L5C TaxID=2839024 RepID=UPI001FAC6B36|nr:hypothetical protein [Methylobacter sp. S3L5C]UOA10060.1 hypothetical protein KKZ03_07380 [Methylobacter sp. S3L5C]
MIARILFGIFGLLMILLGVLIIVFDSTARWECMVLGICFCIIGVFMVRESYCGTTGTVVQALGTFIEGFFRGLY